MMKVLLTGGKGMLGRTIRRILGGRFEIIPTDLPEADITDPGVFSAVLAKHSPDAVIHCAAMTAVDKCETERELAYRLNERGSANVATACKAVGCRLLAISTDYVFDGTGTEPWQADCTEFAPQNVYGESKLAGEKAVRETLESYFIVRTAWVFGLNGKNFVRTMVNCGLSATKSGRRRIRPIWHAFWWTWCRPSGSAPIMRPMKGALSVGRILQPKSSVRPGRT